jgi:hypothetical protein
MSFQGLYKYCSIIKKDGEKCRQVVNLDNNFLKITCWYHDVIYHL